MEPLEVLRNEHGLIRQYLEKLGRAAEKLENGEKVPRSFFDSAIEFFRTFTDRYHHFKEEHILFVRLAQKKKGEVDAALDSLRHEHERGRGVVSEIENSLDGYEQADPVYTERLMESLEAYTTLLRHHIHTEDHLFFPMARDELTDDEKKMLVEEFEKERARAGGRSFEEAHKLLVDMGSLLAHS